LSNYHNGTSVELSSTIYVFNRTTEQFELFQDLTTKGAVDWEHFTIDGTDFLAVCNHQDGDTYSSQSAVYRFNTTKQKFEPFQYIGTFGCVRWNYFTIGTSHFLAVANQYDDENVSYEVDSPIFRFNTTANLFELFQAMPTVGANGWEHCKIGDADFLASASLSNTTSEIFVFNEAVNRFVSFQNASIYGASDWECFEVGIETFLAASNGAQTMVYGFDDATIQFEPAHEIDSPYSRRLEHFAVGDVDYLAIASWEWRSSAGTLDIYQFNSFCFS